LRNEELHDFCSSPNITGRSFGVPNLEAELFTQYYWVFGLIPSSDVLENIKHDVSDTASVSVFR
jgi:hypothetical protein